MSDGKATADGTTGTEGRPPGEQPPAEPPTETETGKRRWSTRRSPSGRR
jgi:hypothetical protein